MKKLASELCLVMLAGSIFAELDAPQIATSATAPSITGYTLSQSRSAQLGALGKLWDGYNGDALESAIKSVKGDIGETVAERAYSYALSVDKELKKGTWVSIAPRYGRQGIDHVFIQVDKNGLPRDMILAESKYKSSKLGPGQMGPNWRMKHLTAIGDRYYRFANSPEAIIRAKEIPIGAKSMDLYFSKTKKVVIWEDGGKWYTNAEEGIADKDLRIRATTYEKYFTSAGTGVIRIRSRLFRILEQENGNYRVEIYKLTDAAPTDAAQIHSLIRTFDIEKEFVAKGRVDVKLLMKRIKSKYPSWSDKQIKKEAEDIKKVISNKDVLNPKEAHKQAIKEINHSSLASAGIAGALSFAFQLGAEAWEHGTDFKSYDFKRISLSTAKGAAVAGVSSYAGQQTALHLAGRTIFKKQISARVAGRIGGSVGASIILAESFGGCVIGNKNWKDGSIEAGISAASMVAGHYAAAGVSALIASSAASGATITAGAAGATAAAGTATAASAGTVGTAAAAGAAGAGTAGSGGFMALAAASGPAIAAIAAGAAISYGGYVVYNHYKSIELTRGDFVFNEKKVDLFLTDKERLYHSLDQLLGFTSSNGYADGVGVR